MLSFREGSRTGSGNASDAISNDEEESGVITDDIIPGAGENGTPGVANAACVIVVNPGDTDTGTNLVLDV